MKHSVRAALWGIFQTGLPVSVHHQGHSTTDPELLQSTPPGPNKSQLFYRHKYLETLLDTVSSTVTTALLIHPSSTHPSIHPCVPAALQASTVRSVVVPAVESDGWAALRAQDGGQKRNRETPQLVNTKVHRHGVTWRIHSNPSILQQSGQKGNCCKKWNPSIYIISSLVKAVRTASNPPEQRTGPAPGWASLTHYCSQTHYIIQSTYSPLYTLLAERGN